MLCRIQRRGRSGAQVCQTPSRSILSLMSSRHYQDAYTTLMIMFGSTAILPPRTKRWAEAKVLADTINFKVRPTLGNKCRKMLMRALRSQSSTCTTMSTRSRCRITTSICAVSQTFRVVGASVRRHSSIGAGWHGSESHRVTYGCCPHRPPDTAYSQNFSSMAPVLHSRFQRMSHSRGRRAHRSLWVVHHSTRTPSGRSD